MGRKFDTFLRHARWIDRRAKGRGPGPKGPEPEGGAKPGGPREEEGPVHRVTFAELAVDFEVYSGCRLSKLGSDADTASWSDKARILQSMWDIAYRTCKGLKDEKWMSKKTRVQTMLAHGISKLQGVLRRP